jgi:hypothetical protein
MSRNWTAHKYCNVESLWEWIDGRLHKIDREVEVAKEATSESYKILLMGRKEVLDWLGDWLHENQTTLGEIAVRWGLGEKDGE